LNTTPYGDISFIYKDGATENFINHKNNREKTNNKVFDWIYNDLFRFLLPTSAVIVLTGFVLLLVLGLFSFVCLLISILV